MLNTYEINQIMKCLKEGIPIPDGYRNILFPTLQKEYEISYSGKMRKEDILANEDGTFPVPLQVDKIFNSTIETNCDEWKNMIVFGDNLQFLKTIYENRDPLIEGKVKDKIKLIYIDPPFATESDFKASKGQKAYNDKVKGSEFIEFLRRRLILAREVLSDDGNIIVHLDNKKSHYIKVVLDEVFGENNFINEIIWHKGREGGSSRSHSPSSSMPTEYQNILIYAKDRKNRFWNPLLGPYKDSTVKNIEKDEIGWYYSRGRMGRKPAEWEKKQGVGLKTYVVKNPNLTKEQAIKQITGPGAEFVAIGDLWNNQFIKFSQVTDYPTEKPEDLIKNLIKAGTQEGEIVLDFFGGSGVTAAVAEKLGRKWIVCDIGKYSYYTMQKRILTLENSKDLNNPKKKYGRNPNSFITAQLGLYHLDKVFELQEDKYKKFVMDLFDVENKSTKISGIYFDGLKGEYPVKIFSYWKDEFKDTSIDEAYLKNLHASLGKKDYSRIYFIAPANYFDFITDYYELDHIRYYFLKIPYQIIKELHKTPFQKLRQPRSKSGVNGLDTAVGFHFIRQPEVKNKVSQNKLTTTVTLKEFRSQYLRDDEGKPLENFESLAMILVDKDFKDEFIMSDIFFAQDLLSNDKNDQTEIIIKYKNKDIGNSIMIVYIDIYGNEFREILNLKDGEFLGRN